VKVLHVLATPSARYGGPSKVCRETCRALARRGWEPTIYTTNLDYPGGVLDVPLGDEVVEEGVRTRHFPVLFRPYLWSPAMGRALRRDLSGFDLVHVHGLYRFPMTAAAWLARRRGVPYLIRPHGSLDPYVYVRGHSPRMKRIHERLLDYRILRGAAAVHYTTQEELEHARRLGLGERGVVVPNGLDLSRYEELPPRGEFRRRHGLGERPVVLHLGRINWVKGLDVLVESFHRLRDRFPEARLALAGPDNEGYGETVRGWIRERGMEEACLFPGMLRGREVLEALVDADVFALPSYSENFGMSVVEAMACGAPVAISDRVSIWREVERNGAGRIAPPEAGPFSKALAELLDDPALRGETGRRGRDFVRRELDWDVVVERLCRLYEEVVGEGA
jgi:glycosyltransferase involved in cell wall biosynthesis